MITLAVVYALSCCAALIWFIGRVNELANDNPSGYDLAVGILTLVTLVLGGLNISDTYDSKPEYVPIVVRVPVLPEAP